MFFNTLIKDGVEAYGASPSVEAYGASASVEAYGASAKNAVESRRGNNCPRLHNQSCVEGSTLSTPCGVATIDPEQLRQIVTPSYQPISQSETSYQPINQSETSYLAL